MWNIHFRIWFMQNANFKRHSHNGHICTFMLARSSPSNAFFTRTSVWWMVPWVCTSTQSPVSSLHMCHMSPPTLDSLSLCHNCLFPQRAYSSLLPADVSSVLVCSPLPTSVELEVDKFLTSKHLSVSPILIRLWIFSGLLAAWSLLTAFHLHSSGMLVISRPSKTCL